MLHWRRKLLRRFSRHVFWAKLLLFSSVVHAVLLFVVFFMYKGSYFSYRVTVSRSFLASGAPVVFLPLYKTIQQKQIKKNSPSVHTKTTKTTGPKQTTKLAAVVKPKKKSIAKKTVQKKKRSTTVAKKKKKPAVKKITKKIAKPIKKEIKTVNKKKTSSPIHKKKKNVQALVHSNRTSVPKQQEPIYVGQMEMDAQWMQNEMHKEVTKKWRPPVGLSKDLVCILKVLIDWHGNTTHTTVEQPSGVLLYDISTRTAMMQLTLPSWAYGKEFTITFKQ